MKKLLVWASNQDLQSISLYSTCGLSQKYENIIIYINRCYLIRIVFLWKDLPGFPLSNSETTVTQQVPITNIMYNPQNCTHLYDCKPHQWCTAYSTRSSSSPPDCQHPSRCNFVQAGRSLGWAPVDRPENNRIETHLMSAVAWSESCYILKNKIWLQNYLYGIFKYIYSHGKN